MQPLTVSRNSRILVLSDLHLPYCHPDLWKFLAACNKRIRPTRVISIGDEVDQHAMSFHDSDVDLLSAGDELKKAIHFLKPIYAMFPVVEVIESNHGSMVYRRGKAHGIPRHVFKSYREVLEAPKGWRWHLDLRITLPNGMDCYFTHGKTTHVTKLSETESCCAVQGHYHEKFGINYWVNANGQLFWQMFVACLIDHRSMAYEYNQTNLKRPILGLGAILNGHPLLLPMFLNSKGRWTGQLP